MSSPELRPRWLVRVDPDVVRAPVDFDRKTALLAANRARRSVRPLAYACCQMRHRLRKLCGALGQLLRLHDARARLQAVPKSKQLGYYSDAYKLEFILPKFRMYKRIFATILAEDFCQGRGWSEEKAIELGKQILRGNVEQVFGCDGVDCSK